MNDFEFQILIGRVWEFVFAADSQKELMNIAVCIPHMTKWFDENEKHSITIEVMTAIIEIYALSTLLDDSLKVKFLMSVLPLLVHVCKANTFSTKAKMTALSSLTELVKSSTESHSAIVKLGILPVLAAILDDGCNDSFKKLNTILILYYLVKDIKSPYRAKICRSGTIEKVAYVFTYPNSVLEKQAAAAFLISFIDEQIVKNNASIFEIVDTCNIANEIELLRAKKCPTPASAVIKLEDEMNDETLTFHSSGESKTCMEADT